jgi:23S rRNA pseudouridine2605 synthase
MKMQLNKYLALCGVCSRRKATIPIVEGRVRVNDEVATELGTEIDPDSDTILLDGQLLIAPVIHRYILLNKPMEAITSAIDGRGRRTVMDLVPVQERIFPVGRLDYDTEGVLLLTNDGDLAYRLTHPKFGVEKVYQAWVEGRVDKVDVKSLNEGVFIDETTQVSGKSVILGHGEDKTQIEIRVHQGKKRQIKRMMKAIGHPVVHLERTCFGGISVGDLNEGEWRDLTDEEVVDLYKLVDLKNCASEGPEAPSVNVHRSEDAIAP